MPLRYALDMRGCGDTDRPESGYTIEKLAQDLFGFVTALGIFRFHLVAHSLGGAVALQFVLDHPTLAQTLTLSAPAPAEGLPLLGESNVNSSWLARLFDLESESARTTLSVFYGAMQNLETNRPLLRRAVQRMAPTMSRADGLDTLVDDAARMPPAAVIGHLRALQTWNIQSELSRINLPVLIVGGARDVIVPRASLERMAHALPNANLQIWADAGHAPQLEQPERFVQTLMTFIDEHVPAEPAAWVEWLHSLWLRFRR